MKKFTIFFFIVLCSFSVSAQIEWQKCLGGTLSEEARSIIQTFDSGYVVAGFALSNDSDVTGNHGGYDCWIVKLDAPGNIQWQQSLGGTSDDQSWCIIQTYDSGYVIAGFSSSSDGDVTGNHGSHDYWIVKLDADGNIEWQKSLGGTGDDKSYSIIQTLDSGYIVAGTSTSSDGDVTVNQGNEDYWIVKLNTSGTIEWQKSLGGSNLDFALSIVQSSDSGYVIAGRSFSNDGDITGNHGGWDIWLVKLNSSGIIAWQKTLGGSGADGTYSIIRTDDNGYVVGGYSTSNDGDVTGNHGSGDYWIVKLDSLASLQWQESLGGTGNDATISIIETSDNGYIASGHSVSNNGDVTGNHGGQDYWLIKLSGSGTIAWQKSLGGTGNDIAYSIIQTMDSGFVVAGYSNSNDGDVTGNHGTRDYWIVKLGVATAIENLFTSNALHVYPNPSTGNFTISANGEFDNAVLNIFNAMGLNVYHGRLNREAKVIDAENFTAGIYYVQVIKGEKVWGEKIIKQ